MNDEEYALIEVKKLDVAVVFSESGMNELLAKIKTKTAELKPDLSTDAGRKEIASMAYKVARSKTLLDDLGKDIIADWKKKTDNINKHRKTARDFLDSLKDEVRKPLTDWEAEQERIKAEKIRVEQERVAGIRAKIEKIKSYVVTSPNTTAAQIEKMIEDVRVFIPVTQEVYQEFMEEAIKTSDAIYDALILARKDRLAWEKAEAERKAESERLAKEKAEQDAKAKALAEERRKIAEQLKRIDDEKKALEAEKRAEEQRKREVEFQRQALENARVKAEKDAAEKIEREAQEKAWREEKEAADKARRAELAPDKDKLLAFADALANVVLPSALVSKEATVILEDATRSLRGLIGMIRKEAKAL